MFKNMIIYRIADSWQCDLQLLEDALQKTVFEECGTTHGNNERIRVETVGRAVRFYVRLMRQC